MPFEAPELTIEERVEQLNHSYRHHAAIPILTHALNDPMVGRVAMVSSFGAESVVLLHMISLINPDTPVLFIDTQMLFQETLDYQTEVAQKLGLTDVRTIRADAAQVKKRDPFARLHLADTASCCNLRKTEPLSNALNDFDAWITGRKRFQAGTRTALDLFEAEENKRLKINPLAHWRREDLQDYIINNRLPRHPLVDQGYPSIGCSPTTCTSKVAAGEDPRSGRWRGSDKVECGIHFSDGGATRTGDQA
ncbi:phosphoadenylyl-sulfate reductase (thioredoxin) [Amylibacter ulvae]|uniref:Phosphoadenosine 5'-phosphosulfate reductase n=1 Tax=Paramylibacter ulvae TaxID=1651968 RepID=A0ABQ3CUY9_9RHOB|nr:phosphoadenylyl-sulfate reductase [Amylibacter ulvae]GHA40267.1 phosphoadenylyl-sulfate reductase (thioredoxin) [Amylibacter ulvae]